MNFRLLPPARRELNDAALYYERQVPGLGAEFYDEVERTIDRIRAWPDAWGRIAPRHRRCLMKRFPYGIIYTIHDDEVLIVSVMNLHRHPDTWKENLN